IMGMMICNDRRWPESWRVLGLQGVELVCIGYNSAAYDPNGGSTEDASLRTFHSTLVTQANAYMNATWAISVAKAGEEDGSGLIGGSCIVDPNGRIVAQAAELPAEIKQAGTLKLTVNSTYAPMEYRDPATNELVGLDVDLANELAKRLGVKIVWSETPFAELIPSLQTRRADFIISGISDRASRRETADFVDYLATGPQFFVMAESEAKAAPDLCGKKVGTTRSTSFPVEIEK